MTFDSSVISQLFHASNPGFYFLLGGLVIAVLKRGIKLSIKHAIICVLYITPITIASLSIWFKTLNIKPTTGGDFLNLLIWGYFWGWVVIRTLLTYGIGHYVFVSQVAYVFNWPKRKTYFIGGLLCATALFISQFFWLHDMRYDELDKYGYEWRQYNKGVLVGDYVITTGKAKERSDNDDLLQGAGWRAANIYRDMVDSGREDEAINFMETLLDSKGLIQLSELYAYSIPTHVKLLYQRGDIRQAIIRLKQAMAKSNRSMFLDYFHEYHFLIDAYVRQVGRTKFESDTELRYDPEFDPDQFSLWAETLRENYDIPKCELRIHQNMGNKAYTAMKFDVSEREYCLAIDVLKKNSIRESPSSPDFESLSLMHDMFALYIASGQYEKASEIYSEMGMLRQGPSKIKIDATSKFLSFARQNNIAPQNIFVEHTIGGAAKLRESDYDRLTNDWVHSTAYTKEEYQKQQSWRSERRSVAEHIIVIGQKNFIDDMNLRINSRRSNAKLPLDDNQVTTKKVFDDYATVVKYERQREFEKAAENLEKLLDCAESHAEKAAMYRRLYGIYAKMKRYDRAVDYCNLYLQYAFLHERQAEGKKDLMNFKKAML